ncbi:MAG: SMP-30/gluconolactonase/LRE family protein, partial [Acidobacteria bacterium]
MFNPFKPLELIKAEVFTSLPAQFRKRSRTAWSDPNRQGAEVECFLEGPSFDREGNLWIVDIPFGRIFRISPKKEWDLVVQYDGWPNGLKFHKDGRAFITDYKKGLLALDPKTARLEPILETAYSESFKGLNDLHFASNGDLYFTDQGQTGITDPTGRVYRLRPNGALDRLCANVPSPNGITLSTTEQHCYVAVTRSQQIWRLPLMADGSVSKTGVAIQLSGGAAGPD